MRLSRARTSAARSRSSAAACSASRTSRSAAAIRPRSTSASARSAAWVAALRAASAVAASASARACWASARSRPVSSAARRSCARTSSRPASARCEWSGISGSGSRDATAARYIGVGSPVVRQASPARSSVKSRAVAGRAGRSGAEPRAGDGALAPEGDVREARAEQRLELLQAQLALVEGVLLARRLRVDPAVGRRDDQQAAGGEHALDPVEHRVLRLEVLDHLEGHDGVEAALVEAVELERRADGELQVGRRVVELGVVDRDGVDVDAGDGLRLAGEDRAAEALAAAEVEHLPARPRSAPPTDSGGSARRRPGCPASTGRSARRSSR